MSGELSPVALSGGMHPFPMRIEKTDHGLADLLSRFAFDETDERLPMVLANDGVGFPDPIRLRVSTMAGRSSIDWRLGIMPRRSDLP